MQLTPEHEQIRDTLKRYIAEHINPHVDEWEAAQMFPAHEVFKGLGDLGLLGLTKPVEYGGMGLDYSYSMLMAETRGLVNCGAIPMAVGVQTDMCTPALARFGSDELRREFLAPAIAGDQVGCIGVSEPGAGSDVAGIKSRARRDGDDYVISGQKMWITNSLQADWMCMLVNTGEGPMHKNKSLIIVPMRDGPSGKLTKGIEVAQKIRKIGMHASDTGLIYFDEVRVPARNLIGQEGQGFIYRCSSSRKSACGPRPMPSPGWTWRSARPSNTRASAGCSAPRCWSSSGCSSSWWSCRPRWRRCARSPGRRASATSRARTYCSGPAWPSSRPGD